VIPGHDRDIIGPVGRTGEYAVRRYGAALLCLSAAGFSITSPFMRGRQVAAGVAIAVWLITTGVVGGVVVWRRTDNAVGWIMLAIANFGAVGSFTQAYAETRVTAGPAGWDVLAAAWLANWVTVPAFVLFVFLFLLFPTGRLPGRRWRWVAWPLAVAAGLGVAAIALTPGTIEAVPRLQNPLALEAAPGLVAGVRAVAPGPEMLGAVAAIASLVVRFRRSRGEERHQVAWLMYAGGVLAASLLFAAVASGPFNDASFVAAMIGLIGIPLSIGIAMLRYRLYDIDLVVNRTIVYAALSGTVVALYILIVGAAGALFQRRVSLGPALVATGLVAVAFQPLRSRLQLIVDRLMYGIRTDPYSTITRLSSKLDAAFAPDEVLPTIVATIADSLGLSYVAIELERDGAYDSAASLGERPATTLELPLAHSGGVVGRLVVGEERGRELAPSGRRLLGDLARHAGVAVAAVRLTEDLRRSREELVMAREEERRRLRRDLHDGLGPYLAGVSLGLGAVRNLVREDPGAATDLLARLQEQVRDATGSVRGLVEGLRPATLDELGLVAALRHKAEALTSPEGPLLEVHAPETMPPLPAGLEGEAFRIAVEALTNAVRHSGAATCSLTIEVGSELVLHIEDDGRGIGDSTSGVGMASMRERAQSLAGSVTVSSAPGRGTSITVRLPLRRG
jgi:signal transduction histidine kinase